MKIFSTFSGIGGFEIGIQNAFDNRPHIRNGSEALHGNSTNASESEVRTVGYSEIDKYATKVYEKQFPGVKNYGDITKINAEELPDFDCLVGGFPCQAFSIAGKRKGFEDTRGTLFFDLARILRAKQPRLFVFENVKGLLSHDGGRTFKTIIATIDELGYDCQWQVLNSKNHGVPQNRERVYIVGHLRGTPRPKVFPIGGADSQDIIVSGILDTEAWRKRHEQIRRFHDTKGISPTIPTGTGGGVMVKIKVPEATKKGYAEATVGQAINLSVPNSKTRRGRVSDIAPTLDTGMQLHTLTEDVRIRRLTPIECERLQGFPDNWTKEGILSHCEGRLCAAGKQDACLGHFQEMSDTQRYKMCGNAVTTNVVQAVFERLLV